MLGIQAAPFVMGAAGGGFVGAASAVPVETGAAASVFVATAASAVSGKTGIFVVMGISGVV